MYNKVLTVLLVVAGLIFAFCIIASFAQYASESQAKALNQAEQCVVYKFKKDAISFVDNECHRYTNWKGVK